MYLEEYRSILIYIYMRARARVCVRACVHLLKVDLGILFPSNLGWVCKKPYISSTLYNARQTKRLAASRNASECRTSVDRPLHALQSGSLVLPVLLQAGTGWNLWSGSTTPERKVPRLRKYPPPAPKTAQTHLLICC